MTFMAQIVYLINKVIKGIHIDYLTPSVNVLHPCTTLHSLYVSIFLPKGHSFCKQCLHDLQFIKTRSSSPNLSKLARADISCQTMKTRSFCRTVYNMNGLYLLFFNSRPYLDSVFNYLYKNLY